MGGIGKTQLAVRYALDCKEEYRSILFFDAETNESLNSSIQIIHQALDLDGPTLEEKIQSLRIWMMQDEPEPFLAIMDNVDSEEALHSVEALLEGKHYYGSFLYTSRRSDLKAIWTSFQLDVFSLQEARDFLYKRTNRSLNEDTDKIIDELGRLPLALEQAAALIIKKDWSYERYLKEFQKKHLELLTEGALANRSGETSSVAVTWVMNLEAMQAVESRAKDFLNLCALMAPETIPYEWVWQGLMSIEPTLYGDLENPEAVESFITELNTYSLIQQKHEEGFSLHRLVQEVIKSRISEPEIDSGRVCCIRSLLKIFPELELAHTCSEHITLQGLYLIGFPLDTQSNDKIHLCFNVGEVLSAQGRFDEALWAYEQAKSEILTLFDTNHIDYASVMLNIGVIYNCKSQPDDALEAFSEAEPVLLALGEEHERFGRLMMNIGTAYQSKRLLNDTLKSYERAKPGLFSLGSESPSYGRLMMNIGNLYSIQGRYADALKAFEEAEPALSTLGKSHPDYCKLLIHLGTLSLVQDKFEEALETYEQAKPSLAILGNENPTFGLLMLNIGNVYSKQEQYQKALECYYDAEPGLSSNPYEFGRLMRNIGTAYTKQDQFTDAIQAFEKAEASLSLFDKEDHEYGLLMIHIGYMYHKQKNYNEALKFYEKAKSALSFLGNNTADFGGLMEAIGMTYVFQGRFKDALTAFRQAEPGLSSLGNTHPYFIVLLIHTGQVLEELKDFPLSKAYFLKAYDFIKHLPTHPFINRLELQLKKFEAIIATAIPDQ